MLEIGLNGQIITPEPGNLLPSSIHPLVTVLVRQHNRNPHPLNKTLVTLEHKLYK